MKREIIKQCRSLLLTRALPDNILSRGIHASLALGSTHIGPAPHEAINQVGVLANSEGRKSAQRGIGDERSEEDVPVLLVGAAESEITRGVATGPLRGKQSGEQLNSDEEEQEDISRPRQRNS